MNKNFKQIDKSIISKLSSIKQDLIQQYGIKNLALFGSYAKAHQKLNSDLDLVVFADKKNYFKLIEMEKYIEARLHIKVDIGFYDGMNSFIKKEIKKDLIYV